MTAAALRLARGRHRRWPKALHVHDARIAALCIAHGVAELWTADRDFNRFAPLRTANPLVEGSER